MELVARLRHLRARLKTDGPRVVAHQVRVKLTRSLLPGVMGEEHARRAAEEEAYQGWIRRQVPSAEEAARQAGASFTHRLTFLIPTYNTRPELLAALVDSLLAQTCPLWEACFYDGASPREDTRRELMRQAARDERIRVALGDENLSISGNTNRALAMARTDYVALCDHDDLLTPDAVYHVLAAAETGADMIYSDEDKCNEDGTRFFDPHLKADFAPDALRAGNYICHLMALRTELMRSLGGLRSAYDGSQDHDLALRASEKAERIVHIPRILYHWRMLNTSFSHQGAERCARAATAAVEDQLRRLQLPATVRMEELRPRIAWQTPDEPCVSLVLHGAGKVGAGELRRLLRGTRHVQEVLLLGAEHAPRCGVDVRALPWQGSLSEGLNHAAAQAKGRYVLFAARGLRPCRGGDWLREMLMHAARPDVGCVGGPICHGRALQYLHAGYAVDVPGGALSHHAGQSYYGHPYMITDRLVRNVTGVSAALLLMRRDRFLEAGGFGGYASDLRGADLGLSAQGKGWLNVYVPYARMRFKGAAPPCLTGPAPAEDISLLRSRHGEHPRERYYSPLFEKLRGSMTPDMEEAQA